MQQQIVRMITRIRSHLRRRIEIVLARHWGDDRSIDKPLSKLVPIEFREIDFKLSHHIRRAKPLAKLLPTQWRHGQSHACSTLSRHILQCWCQILWRSRRTPRVPTLQKLVIPARHDDANCTHQWRRRRVEQAIIGIHQKAHVGIIPRCFRSGLLRPPCRDDRIIAFVFIGSIANAIDIDRFGAMFIGNAPPPHNTR